MTGDRGFALLADNDQWTRCDHRNTALIASGGVQLAWVNDTPTPRPARTVPAGLAFDRWYRAYRSHPDQGRVSMPAVHGGAVEPEAADPPEVRCDVSLRTPLGLAVDADQRLYVAEAGAAVVRIVDLWAGRLVRRMPMRTAADPRRRPLDVAATGTSAIALVHEPVGLVEIRGRRGPRPGPALHRPRKGTGLEPVRVAGTPTGRILALWRAPDTGRSVVAWPDGTVLIDDLARAPTLR